MVNFELILTTRCNLSCDYCYARFLKKQDMPFALIKKLLDKHPVSKLIFTGGEPLLKLELIKRTVAYVKRRKKKVSYRLQTNGTILNQEIIKFIKDNDMEVDISLDGLKGSHDAHRQLLEKKTGSYRPILNNLDSLNKNGVKLSLNYTVNPDTIDGLAGNLLALIKKYRVDVGFVFTDKRISNSTKRAYISELKKFLSNYIKKLLFLEIDKIYPFEHWFRALLFGQDEIIKEALDVKCKYHRLRLFPGGEVFPCVAAFSLIPSEFRHRCDFGTIDKLNYRRLKYFQNDFDLSNWHNDKKLKGCNRVCYLYAQDPANRFEFEKKVNSAVISMLKSYLDNLHPLQKEYIKMVIQNSLPKKNEIQD